MPSKICPVCGATITKKFKANLDQVKTCSYKCGQVIAQSGRISLLERFWGRVNKTQTCWEWLGAKDVDGYGRTFANGKQIGAHRLSWVLKFNAIPDGAAVCHRCDNPGCVNPEHLFLGTHADNMADMVAKCRQGWKLTEEQVVEIRKLKGSMRQRRIAEKYGVTPTTISEILLGKTWPHLK